MIKINLFPILFITVLLSSFIQCQNSFAPTNLETLYPFYRLYQSSLISINGRTSEDPTNMRLARQQNLLQKEVPASVPFPCNVTGFRSVKPPTSVHQVRPGDIDVVGALGDSLTAGFGLVATNILQVLIENRGLSWSIGGQGTWRQYLTLPNILKEFNPNLFGYSLGDSITSERKSQFNPAEGAAISSEIPYMTKILIKRIRRDRRVNLKKHWKLITIMIGSNDICLDVCFYKNTTLFLELHRQDLITVIRLLRDSLPRTIVSLVAPPNLKAVVDQKPTPEICELVHQMECYCLFAEKFKPNLEKYYDLNAKMQKIDEEVASMPEFHQNDDFTVVFQPAFLGVSIPLINENLTDFTYLSKDCFHLSQKMNARAANAIWNNMLERVGNKTGALYPIFDQFLCPTKENPFIFTNENS